MKLGKTDVGEGFPPFIVAEMSGNHNQSLDRALQIVEAAHQAGAHAIKLQTYTADTITLPIHEREFVISDPKMPWKGRSLHELYQEAYTPWEWHGPIFQRASELGLVCFSSPFDESAVEFLEELGAPCYKIASFENNDLPLIRKAASTGKPIIISTGMATEEEIGEAVAAARDAGCRDMVLLKCTSTYPASPKNTNILTIPHMRSVFGCQVGLSDHTAGIGVAVASVSLGASVIEKHFTLRRADGGVDSTFSMEPAEMASLVSETLRAWQALGSVSYGCTPAEESSRRYRRSLYVVADMQAGEAFTKTNVRSIRPGLGLAPKFLPEVLGRKAARPLVKGMPLSWDLIV
jgi:N-acetylneuraminate synthase